MWSSDPARVVEAFAAAMVRRWRWLPCACVPAVLGCGGARQEPRPVVGVATTTEAAEAYAPIRAGWHDLLATRSPELEAMLDGFLKRFPGDGLAPRARALLAMVRTDRGKLADADALLVPMERLEQGTTHDFAVTARARWYRRRGEAARAHATLSPLVGKVVDPELRGLVAGEIALAALDAGRPFEAVAHLDAWLRSADEEERERVRARVVEALRALPKPVLMEALRSMRAPTSGYGLDLRRLVVDRLVELALADKDAQLAAELLGENGGEALVTGDRAGALTEVAARRFAATNVAGRTIGLLLPSSDNRRQPASAEVLRGVGWALGLPAASLTDGVRMTTRDEARGGSVEEGLDALAADGASVIIAGLDADGSDRALRWAELLSLPVIVLAAPNGQKPGAFGFVVGEPLVAELDLLAAGLVEHKAFVVAPILGDRAAEAPLVAALTARDLTVAPVLLCDDAPSGSLARIAWITARGRPSADAYLVAGPERCTRAVLREVGRRSSVLATTLEASTPHEASALAFLRAGAGVFPDGNDDDLGRYEKEQLRAPTYWAAMGHDAGRLAEVAAKALPTDAATSETEVRRRRVRARDALAFAQVPLWTTEARGFGDSHALARTLRVSFTPPARR